MDQSAQESELEGYNSAESTPPESGCTTQDEVVDDTFIKSNNLEEDEPTTQQPDAAVTTGSKPQIDSSSGHESVLLHPSSSSADLVHNIIQGIKSDDPTLQLTACQSLLLTTPQKSESSLSSSTASLPSILNSLLDPIIEAGLVGQILGFTTSSPSSSSSSLRTAAAWVVASLARIESKLLVDKGAIPKLIQILTAERLDLTNASPVIPAAYGLSVLAITSGGYDKRLFVNEIRDGGVIPILRSRVRHVLDEMSTTTSNGDLYPLLLALTRLAKSVCYVPKNVKITTDRMSLLKTLCDICARVRIDENSSWTEVDILYHATWGLYYLTKTGREDAMDVLVRRNEDNESPTIIQNLVHGVALAQRDGQNHHLRQRLLRPCLNVIGNVVSSTVDVHTDIVLECGVLPHLNRLMLEAEWTGEVNWIVSNIAAGNVTQKEELFQAGFFPLLLDVFRSGSLPGRKEAVFTVVNIMDKGSLAHKEWLVNNGVLSLLIQLVKEHPDLVLVNVLDAIYLFVKSFRSPNNSLDDEDILQRHLNESGVLVELSKFQDHEDDEVTNRIDYILDVGLNNSNNWNI
ncbi:importin subunit alpha-3 [Folsomia candida]|uniref:importin subunit alpha-3 n=1 Tax=Folsomia candida TaxID=158441 RepID=UPI001604A688|nr:importin subunit alpha-3 [Folsomia candida]